MKVGGNLYIAYLENMAVQRVVSVRPASSLRKDRNKRGKNGQDLESSNKVSFNDCLEKNLEDIKGLDGCEENQEKRLHM